MWMFFGLTTSYHVFGADNSGDLRFALGQEWGGNAFAIYSIVCFAIAFLLPKLAAATSRKTVHAISLICGGLGLLSVYFIQDKWVLLVTMIGVGIAWASILSMPYAILSGALPLARMGVYMGIFNFFIVIPEIIASLFFGRVIRAIFGANSTVAPLYMVMAGGAFMLVAASLVALVEDVSPAARYVKGSLLPEGLGFAGLLIGGLVGFLLRPSGSVFGLEVGQLPFKDVITRGGSLKGADLILTPIAQSSFNYLLAGAIVGAVCGVLLGYFIFRSRKQEPPDPPVPIDAVIEADKHELFTVPGSVQPVPSTGLIDEE